MDNTKFHDLFAAHASGNAEATHTLWPDAAERLRPTLDAWCKYTGFKPQAKAHQERYLAGASDWVAQYGEDATDLLVEAMNWGVAHNYTLVTPKSCIQIAASLKTNEKPVIEEDRSRYLDAAERM